MKKIKGIIFDYDFTLVDSSKGILACTNYALDKMNKSTVSLEVLKPTIGYDLEDTYTLLTGDSRLENQQLFKSYFIEKADVPGSVLTTNTSLLTGVQALLDWAQVQNLKLAIVTTKRSLSVKDSLHYLALQHYFSEVIARNDVIKAKPDPEGINKVLAKLEFDVDEIIYVGDSIVDAQAAKNAGVAFVGVTTGSTTKQDFQRYPNLAVLQQLLELKDLDIVSAKHNKSQHARNT